MSVDIDPKGTRMYTTKELTEKIEQALREGKLQDAQMYRDARDAQQVAEVNERTEWTPEQVTA